MAATAVYARTTKVPKDAVPGKAAPQFANISTTTAPFYLDGGTYGLSVKASTFGTVTLQVLLADDVTYATAATAFSGDGFAVVDLPPGMYKWAIA